LVSAVSAFDMHTVSPGTLSPYFFGGTLVGFICFCVGASKNTAAYVAVNIVVFVSQAPVGLRRDLGMVREFAMNVKG